MSVDQFRARIAALQAEFQTLEAQYRERYAYDFSDWEADDDQFEETIRGAIALQAQFEALPGKVSALREELVGLVQQAEAGRDMAQSALDAAEAAVSEAEDLASDADLLDDGEFERDDMNDTVAALEVRRRELMTGDGEKGVSRHMLKRKAAKGTVRIQRRQAKMGSTFDELRQEARLNRRAADSVIRALSQAYADYEAAIDAADNGAANQAANSIEELTRQIDELNARGREIAAEAIAARDTAGDDDQDGKSAKAAGDGRDYGDRIAAARDTIEQVRAEAEALMQREQSPSVVRAGLEELSGQISELRLRIPVSDYDAEPIAEGREVDQMASDLLIWLEEQHGQFTINADTRPHSIKAATAHTLYA